MDFIRKFTSGMFQRSVRNFCPKIVRNEGKSVRKLNVRNFLQVMYSAEFTAGVQSEPVIR